MKPIHLCSLFGVLLALAMLAGCAANSPATEPAATQASENLTPEGDSLNGPIPYPHWPYDIERGGGGATGR